MTFHDVATLLGAVALLFGCGIGIPTTYYAARGRREQSAALDRAEPVEATVTNASVERHRDAGKGPFDRMKHRYRPVVRFRYEYDGTTHESAWKSFRTRFGQTTESRAERTVDQYPEGETVTAYVDPHHPDEGFLQAEDPAGSAGASLLLVMGLGLTLIGVLGGVLVVAVLFVL